MPGAAAGVYGVTEYGVLQKGDAKPFRLVYFPKAVGRHRGKAVGDPLKVEIVPVHRRSARRNSRCCPAASPVTNAETTVLVPEQAKQMVKTDKDGFTPGTRRRAATASMPA